VLPLRESCNWPGNIGELQNIIERSVILAAAIRSGLPFANPCSSQR
jgi:transcriptional regulator with GAF, ATPase, and Fis domain